MSRAPVLTDELIRAALATSSATNAPVEVLGAVAACIRRTPQRRALLPWPGTWILTTSRGRFALAVAVAASLLALLGGLLAGGYLHRARPAGEPLFDSPAAVRLLAVGREEAWIAAPDPAQDVFHYRLWHRTRDGWAGPIEIENGATGIIRDLDLLPDGRLAVAADNGLWIGRQDGWVKTNAGRSWGVEVTGETLWATTDGWLLRLREVDGAWQTERIRCEDGGLLLAVGTDGSVWTTGFGYGPWGLTRWEGSTCTEIFPFSDGIVHAVGAIAAGPDGTLLASVSERSDPDGGARIMRWDGASWSTIRQMRPATFLALDFGPDGTPWAAFEDHVWWYGDGDWHIAADTWAQLVSVADDGTVWYLEPSPSGGVATTLPAVPAER